ncbi:MAG: hypothetical protein ACI8TQ_003307, partial [Planctomycetota bacterium]
MLGCFAQSDQRSIGREFFLDDETGDVGRDPIGQFSTRPFAEGSLACDRPSLGGGVDRKLLKLRVLSTRTGVDVVVLFGGLHACTSSVWRV